MNSDTLMLSSILCSNMALKTGERAVGGGEGKKEKGMGREGREGRRVRGREGSKEEGGGGEREREEGGTEG